MVFFASKLISTSAWDEVGIFRVPGENSVMLELKHQYDAGMSVIASVSVAPCFDFFLGLCVYQYCTHSCSNLNAFFLVYVTYPAGEKVNLDAVKDPHTLAGLLKLWFRELPEPVLIFRYYSTFLKVSRTRFEHEYL